MQSTAATPMPFPGWPRPVALTDLAIAAVVLAGSLALLFHGGIVPFRRE